MNDVWLDLHEIMVDWIRSRLPFMYLFAQQREKLENPGKELVVDEVHNLFAHSFI
jgi:hypothetical protein